MRSKQIISIVNHMKFAKLLMFSLASLLLSCSSGEQVVTSAKQFPNWVTGIESDCLIGMGEAANFVEAKEAAMDDIARKLSKSIARQSGHWQRLTTENSSSGKSVRTVEDYKSVGEHTAFPQTFTGLSIEKALDYFWIEHRSPSGASRVTYYVKYPFSAHQLNDEIAKWEASIAAVSKSYEVLLCREIPMCSTSEIFEELGVLSMAPAYLDAGLRVRIDHRKAQVQHLIESMGVEMILSEPGAITVALMRDDLIVRSASAPEVKTNPATEFTVIPRDNFWLIKYETNETARTEIEVSFDLKSRKATGKFSVSNYSAELRMTLAGAITVSKVSDPEEGITYMKLSIPLEIHSNSLITMDRLEIQTSRSTVSFWGKSSIKSLGHYTIEPISDVDRGKGNHVVELYFDDAFTEEWELGRYANLLASGTITVKSRVDGVGYELPFSEITLKTQKL